MSQHNEMTTRLMRTIAATFVAMLLASGLVAASSTPASAATYSISGTVTLPAGADANWWRAVSVQASNTSTGSTWSTSILSNGTYSLGGLPSGTWRVRTSTYDYWIGDVRYPRPNLVSVYYPSAFVSDDATLITLSANRTGINMTLTTGRTISGKITLSGTTSSSYFKGVRVVASDSDAGYHSTVPDSSGNYTINGLPPATFDLEFYASGYWQDESADAPWIEVPLASRYYPNTYDYEARERVSVVSANATGKNQTLQRLRKVTGKVTFPSGTTAQARAATSVSFRGDNKLFAYADVNDTTGAYSVMLPASKYLFSAYPGAYYDDNDVLIRPNLLQTYYPNTPFESSSTKITVSTADLSGRNLAVHAGRTVSGTVTFPAGTSLADKEKLAIYAEPYGQESGSIFRADFDPATGKYSIPRLLPQKYGLNLQTAPGVSPPVWAIKPNSAYDASADLTSASKSSVNMAALRTFPTSPAPTVSWHNGKAGLSANIGAWVPTPSSMTYQWYKNGVAISGATGTTYILKATDRGSKMEVRVTGKLAGYANLTRSSGNYNIALLEFDTAPVPTVTGTPKASYTLTAKAGTWSPKPTTLSYQWYRGDTKISGATKSTYKLTSADRGKSISVKVTGKSTGFVTKTTSSAAVSVVKPAFKDVSETNSAFDEIQWMNSSGVSTGYSDGTYRPDASVLRGHMAQFLHRVEGSPAVTAPPTSPFSDVPTTSSAYNAILWLRDEGITTVNPFNPNGKVTRRQMALFLHRMAGEPPVTLPSKSPFKDVSSSESAYPAIIWLEQQGITTGYADGTFRPSTPIIRSHMAMFLYRYAHLAG